MDSEGFDGARFGGREPKDSTVPSPVLLTHRLRLRPIRHDDALAMFGVFGDPETMRFWDAPPRRTIAETAQLLRGYLAAKQCRCLSWVITHRDEPTPLGVIWLGVVEPASRKGKIKFVLGRNHWRQGLMTEALVRILDHTFRDLRLHRVEACRHLEDERSGQLLHRLGFEREGTLRQSLFVENSYRDVDLHSLLAHDWLGRPSCTPSGKFRTTTKMFGTVKGNRPEPLCADLNDHFRVSQQYFVPTFGMRPPQAERWTRIGKFVTSAASVAYRLAGLLGSLAAGPRAEIDLDRGRTVLGSLLEREWAEVRLSNRDALRLVERRRSAL